MHVALLFCVFAFIIPYISIPLPVRVTHVVFLPSSRSNETSGGAEETGGAPQPGAAEAKADRDEVCFLS